MDTASIAAGTTSVADGAVAVEMLPLKSLTNETLGEKVNVVGCGATMYRRVNESLMVTTRDRETVAVDASRSDVENVLEKVPDLSCDWVNVGLNDVDAARLKEVVCVEGGVKVGLRVAVGVRCRVREIVRDRDSVFVRGAT